MVVLTAGAEGEAMTAARRLEAATTDLTARTMTSETGLAAYVTENYSAS